MNDRRLKRRYLAFGDQGALLKNCPLDPRKTFGYYMSDVVGCREANSSISPHIGSPRRGVLNPWKTFD